MLKKLIIFSLLFASIVESLPAQRIRGAEMKIHANQNTIFLTAHVYRQGNSKPQVTVDWGDGLVETIPLAASNLHISGYRRDVYGSYHDYDSTGLYAITLRDTFLFKDVVNILNSGDQFIELTDTVQLFPYGHAYNLNHGPEWFGSQFLINVENGIVTHPATIAFSSEFNSYKLSIAPFPSPGFQYPEATNGIYLAFNSFLVWDRPVEPGTYAIAIHALEYDNDPSTPEPNDSVLLATATRAMMIDVDSSMIISFLPAFPNTILNIFPNPVSEILHIEATGLSNQSDYLLEITNTQGRLLYQKTGKTVGGGIATDSIEVECWPPGLYYLTISFGEYQAIKPFIIE